MAEIVVVTLMFLIYGASMTLSLMGDWILRKTQLRNCEPVTAEIIYFDEVHFVKGGCKVTVVHYMENGISKDAFVFKTKGDVVGSNIDIVTDGCLAVRKENTLRESISVVKNIIALIIIFVLGKYIVMFDEVLSIIVLLILLGFIVVIAILYPYFYKAYYDAIRQKLGWSR